MSTPRMPLGLWAKVFLTATIATALTVSTLGCPPAPPPACGQTACPAGTRLACLDKCEAVVPSGGTCSLDRCSTDPSGLCDFGMTCLPNPFVPGIGVCIALPNNGGVLGVSCESDLGFDPCSNDLWCNPTSCTDHTATCALSANIGSPCDSNFNAPLCGPCGPGGLCEGTGATCKSTGGIGKACHQPCATAADCPCDQGGSTSFSCVDPYGQGSSCYECRKLTDACDSEHPCCDGSTCPDGCGTCCLGGKTPCSSQSDCCPGLICSASSPLAASTCHACGPIGGFCDTNADCCNGACDTPSHTCKEPTGGACTSTADCANATPCTCGICSHATPLGVNCQAGKEGACLCASSETGATCTDNLCCVGKCAPCETAADCCRTNNAIRQDCEASDDNPQIKRCCGIVNAPCVTDNDCCAQHLCQSATSGAPLTCVPTPGHNFHNFCDGAGGCAASGQSCTATTTCCAPNECTDGKCALPSSYQVLGYDFNFGSVPIITATRDYTYQIAQGVPIAVSAQSDAFVITQSPNQLIAIPPRDVASAIVQPYPFVPRTIDAFATNGADSTADLVIGSDGQAAWLQNYNFVTNTAISTNTVTFAGRTVSSSPSPLFNMSEHDVSLAITGAPDRLEYVLFGNVPPTVPGNVDLTTYGTPVGVSTGADNVWLVTNSQLAEFGIQALGPLTSAQLPVPGAPVTVAGADLIGQVAADFIVVAFQPTSTAQAQIIAFHGGNPNDPLVIPHSFSGSPVQLRITSTVDLEYAWVATTNPNQILVFVISTANSLPVATLPLPGAPIDFVAGSLPGIQLDGGGGHGTTSGLVNVIVAQ